MSTHANRKMVGAAFLAFCVCALAFALTYKRGFEHTLAALPHWSTRCPRNATAILVIGQSQASNTGPKRHISFSGSRSFADGRCFYLRDPMPGTGGRGGTIWPTFAAELDRKVVIANIAISGSAIEEWTTPGQLAKFRRTLNDLRSAGYPDPLIIWMQGETNGARQTSAQDYYTNLRTLFRVAAKRRWLITRESICYDKQGKWQALDVARNRLKREVGNVIIGPDLDMFPLALRQGDRCHFNVEGQRKLGVALAAAAATVLGR